MAEVSKCKVEYPEFPPQERFSAARMDMEDSRYAGAALGYTLCKIGEAFQSLIRGYATSH